MASTRQSKRARLDEYLAQARPERVGGTQWRELQERLAPVSDSYLRRLLRATGVPLEPLVEGVRQNSFE